MAIIDNDFIAWRDEQELRFPQYFTDPSASRVHMKFREEVALAAFRAGKAIGRERAIAALESPLPSGWVAVPVKTTIEMRAAGQNADDYQHSSSTVASIYEAMIAAAPKLAGEEKI